VIAPQNYYSGIKTPRIVHFEVRPIVRETADFYLSALTRLLVLISKREWLVPFSPVASAVAGPCHCANVESMKSRVYSALSTCRSQEIWRRADRPSLLS